MSAVQCCVSGLGWAPGWFWAPAEPMAGVSASTSAPASSSTLASVSSPRMAAIISGVRPCSLTVLILVAGSSCSACGIRSGRAEPNILKARSIFSFL